MWITCGKKTPEMCFFTCEFNIFTKLKRYLVVFLHDCLFSPHVDHIYIKYKALTTDTGLSLLGEPLEAARPQFTCAWGFHKETAEEEGLSCSVNKCRWSQREMIYILFHTNYLQTCKKVRVPARRPSLTFGTNIWKKNNEGLKIRSGAFSCTLQSGAGLAQV